MQLNRFRAFHAAVSNNWLNFVFLCFDAFTNITSVLAAFTVKSITVSVSMKNCRQLKLFVRKVEIFHDSLGFKPLWNIYFDGLLWAHFSQRWLYVMWLLGWKNEDTFVLENCRRSNLKIKNFFITEFVIVQKIKVSPLQRSLKICRTIFSSIVLRNVEY